MTKLLKCTVKYCRNQRQHNRLICAKHRMQQWRRNNPITEILNTIRSRARKKGIACSLTLVEFKQFCQEHNYTPGVHHIDRIDPTDGYRLHNIQVLGGSENIAKGNQERHSERYQAYLASRKQATPEIDCPY